MIFRACWVLALILLAWVTAGTPAIAEEDGKALYSSGRHDEAIAWWRRAVAERNDPEAAFRLGDTYEAGAVVEENLSEAAKWYEIAAKAGHPEAQSALGAFYDAGAGVEQSTEKAAYWYGQCAARGDATCQFQVGRLYSLGKPATDDLVEAYKWYYLAAKGGQIAFDSDEFTALAGRMTAAQKQAAVQRALAFAPIK